MIDAGCAHSLVVDSGPHAGVNLRRKEAATILGSCLQGFVQDSDAVLRKEQQ